MNDATISQLVKSIRSVKRELAEVEAVIKRETALKRDYTEMLPIAEYAQKHNLSRHSLYIYINEGRIKAAKKIRGKWHLPAYLSPETINSKYKSYAK